MYPKKLSPENKHKWYTEDVFTGEKSNIISQFVHKNYNIGMHTHSFYELNIVLEGIGRHYIKNKSFDATVGDVYIIPIGVEHGYYSDDTFNVYHMLIHQDFITALPSELKESFGFSMLFEIEPQLRSNVSDSMFLKLSSDKLNKLQTLSELISDASKTNSSDVFINLYAQNILAFLSFEMEKKFGSNSKINSKYSDLTNAIRYIQLHYEEKITIEMLADICFMSRSTFLRRFHSAFGITPLEYINRYRIKMYHDFISLGYTKTEASVMCGFYDYSHLSKTIKKCK